MALLNHCFQQTQNEKKRKTSKGGQLYMEFFLSIESPILFDFIGANLAYFLDSFECQKAKIKPQTDLLCSRNLLFPDYTGN